MTSEAQPTGEFAAVRRRMVQSMEGRVACGLTETGARRAREELADAIIADLGLRPARPFDKASHGLGCWSRKGGACDCTVSDGGYWRMDLSGRTEGASDGR